jgi:hypothetical protein
MALQRASADLLKGEQDLAAAAAAKAKALADLKAAASAV